MFSTFLTFSLFTIIFWALVAQNVVSACELSMGYRTSERLPLIHKKPNNSGLYQSLYALAAERIGCTLSVVRGPKKRILNELYLGDIDFYPGFNFNESRAQLVAYIDNGLFGGDIGVSRVDLEDITDLTQLKGLTYITSLGSTNFLQGIEEINIRFVKEMGVARAILLIQKKRGDFYIYNRASIKYHLKMNNITGIKLHPDCCGGIKPLYLGFSKQSKHYQSLANPEYLPKQKLSIENFPTVLAPTSIAYQFQQSLKQLQTSGVTKKLYARYYK